jgi:hypothetical protein
MSTAAQGRRLRFDQPLSVRTRVVRTAVAAFSALVVLAQLTAPAASGRAWLADQARLVVHGPMEPVAVAPAWSVTWTRPQGARPQPCGSTPTQALVVSFKRPASVDRVTLVAGLDRKTSDWSKEYVPRIVDIAFSDRTCRRVRLADSGTEQSFDLSVKRASGARVSVVDAFAPASGTGHTVSISALRFLHW